MGRHLCIHAHFYQPPRENPWLEAIELQDSAYPHHDWNERITAECYGPNATSRIMDAEGRIEKIVNNYARISFNFGPTLLAWMEEKTPEVYGAVLEADRQSAERFSGHGSAIAQAHNHMIMPLALPRDKRTQVRWGIADFRHRFGRDPEGMWLPETAVDLETLEIMAAEGIAFTILEPHQAARVRPIHSPADESPLGEEGEVGSTGGEGEEEAEEAWRDVTGGKIDPTRPYLCRLPSGGEIVLFFYDGPVSRAVAFENLLSSGERFADRLMGLFGADGDRPQLVHIATDGETYGHHHRNGDMALAYALETIEADEGVRLTNYGRYLELHPPAHEVEIYEDTSWSCAHGVERWESDCGCSSGMHPGWDQAWRAPLRQALDWLRDRLAPLYEERAGKLLEDPWAARDDYVEVLLDRSQADRFLERHASRRLSPEETIDALKLLELQRHAMLMYTSCGWFFDELSGIETVQVIQYAGRALQLARQVLGEDLRQGFLERLEAARSNIPDHRNGRVVFERFVERAMVDLTEVGAHYALSSLFEEYPTQTDVHCFRVRREDHVQYESGRARLGVGRARVTSKITQESAQLDFGVVHFGDHNLTGGVRAHHGQDPYRRMRTEVAEAFQRADLPETVRGLDRHFGSHPYSLKSLFRDEQRKILDLILEATLQEVAEEYRQVYGSHAPLMRFLADLGSPLPRALHAAAEFVVNLELRRAFEDEELDPREVGTLLEEARAWELALDTAGLAYALQQTLEGLIADLASVPGRLPLLRRLEEVAGLARSLPFEVDLTRTQNLYWELLQSAYPEFHRKTSGKDQHARGWVEHFRALGERLGVRVP